MKPYVVAHGANHHKLVARVTELMAQGYEPIGGVASTGSSWAQALVLKADIKASAPPAKTDSAPAAARGAGKTLRRKRA